MNRILLASAGLFLFGVASCSSGASTTTPGSGGNNGTAGTGTSGSAGTSGEAGTSGGAGTSGSAGTSGEAGTSGGAGTTGSTGTAGTVGSAGTSGTAGTGGSASGAAGRGGTTGTAGTGTAGGSGTAGRGGTTGTAGTGAAGRGGTTGTAGTTGAGGDNLSVVGTWDGALVTFPCNDKRSGYDCSNLNCTGGTATKTTTWTMAGTAGTVYNVTVRIRGIVEVQAYGYPGSGMRDAASASISSCPTAGCDLFQRGGTPMASGGVSYDYNNYELSVSPGVPTSASMYNTYYLNSVIMNENPHASSGITSHLTFPIDYTKTIPVMGNSTVTLKVFDSNCALVQNCGPTSGNTCVAPRTVSLSGAMPAPANFTQPYQGNVTGAYGQWVHFDVTGVTVAP